MQNQCFDNYCIDIFSDSSLVFVAVIEPLHWFSVSAKYSCRFVMSGLYRTLFPASRCLFMYRDIVAVAKSFYRLTLVDAYLRLFWFVGRLSGPMTMMINETFGSLCSRVPRLDSELTVGVLLAAVATRTYLELTQDYHPSMLLHCWLGHLTCKIVSEMTYNVSSGTLNPTIPIPYHTIPVGMSNTCICQQMTHSLYA